LGHMATSVSPRTASFVSLFNNLARPTDKGRLSCPLVFWCFRRIAAVVLPSAFHMRLGIFSDVHANYEALSAVLEAYKHEQLDCYYCLGDTVGLSLIPNECSDIVRDLAKATILGNHDAAVAGRMDYSYYYEAARNALDTHAQLLSDANMEWLRSLPYEKRLSDLDLQLCHGSPVRLEEFEYIFAPEQAQECLSLIHI